MAKYEKFSSATAWIVVLILVIFSSLMLVRTGTNSTAINFSEFQKVGYKMKLKVFKLKMIK
ncbi:hypothetical protein JTT01_21075 [Clostridium botulinum]|nr:hypothetical protein [Clostridium botulinum]MCS4515912.1 hypothetical protein [Clostridium botulinum]